LERSVGSYLYGRRMYETMVFWESPPELTAQPPFVQDFAEIWQRADKIVYSRTLQTVTSAKTLIEREFDPEAIRQLKAKAGGDLSIGGSALAAPGDQGWARRRVSAVPHARRGGSPAALPARLRCPG